MTDKTEEKANNNISNYWKINRLTIITFLLSLIISFCVIVVPFIGILALLLWFLTIVFAIVGVVKACACSKGVWPAVLNLVLLIGFIISIFIALPQHGVLRPPTMHLISKFNLLNINRAIMIYRSFEDSVQTTNDKGEVTYNGPLPTNLEILMKSGWPSECNTFKNPFSKEELKWVNGKFKGEVGYVIFLDRPEDYTGFYDEDKKFTTGHICGYEKIKFAYKGKVWVLISGGNMQEMTVEELNKQLKAENRPPAE